MQSAYDTNKLVFILHLQNGHVWQRYLHSLPSQPLFGCRIQPFFPHASLDYLSANSHQSSKREANGAVFLNLRRWPIGNRLALPGDVELKKSSHAKPRRERRLNSLLPVFAPSRGANRIRHRLLSGVEAKIGVLRGLASGFCRKVPDYAV